MANGVGTAPRIQTNKNANVLKHPPMPFDLDFKQTVAGYAQMLAENGFLLKHWMVVRDLWLEALKDSPYMEAYEKMNMDLGTDSAAYRFFTQHVLQPMTSAITAMDEVYENPTNTAMVSCFRYNSCQSLMYSFQWYDVSGGPQLHVFTQFFRFVRIRQCNTIQYNTSGMLQEIRAWCHVFLFVLRREKEAGGGDGGKM